MYKAKAKKEERRKKYWNTQQQKLISKYYLEQKEPDTKEHILRAFIYIV